MALSRKYANLPDLDSAPDVYETPELTDDVSTVPTSVAHTQSDEEDVEVGRFEDGISRSRLRINEARSRFQPANVDPSDVDFSDRVDGKRKSYKTSSRRQRVLDDGTYEFGDLSDDDDEESLERRIARLRREVQEAKNDHARLQTASGTNGNSDGDSRLQTLSEVLDEISQPIGVTHSNQSEPTEASTGDGEQPSMETADRKTDRPTYTVTYAPSYEQSHALATAADFDRRLVALEKGLGLSVSSVPETGHDGLPRAILPTLDSMEKQISSLAQASTPNLDAIARRVRTLIQEQEKLNEASEKAKTLREELGKNAPASSGDGSDQETKINALYGVLPTIENLTPMLPPLLDRLRSLREIHTNAATASQTLDEIEQRQSEMTTELKQWNEGLVKLESTMKEGETTMKNNMTVIEGWVKDLEQKMQKVA